MRLAPMTLGFAAVLLGALTLSAADQPSPAAAMLRLLQSGRVPEARLPTIVQLVTERGNSSDLQYLLEQVEQPDHWPASLRADTLKWLATATRERKVRPNGDLSGVVRFLDSSNDELRAAAVDLAGLWKIAGAEQSLLKLARDSETSRALRKRALESLTKIDQDQALKLLTSLADKDQSFEMRSMAVSVLSRLNAKQAAEIAVNVLQQAGPRDDPAPLVDAFLELKSGAATLAGALKETPPTQDMAKLMLRHMYSIGRTDEELNSVLSKIAGISETAPPPTKEEIAALVKEVERAGDPHRGEQVFRRKDLSCMNCHAVSKAGGQIGPDLSAVGASSPVEYLVSSVLTPDQAIKEAFVTKVIATVDGRILQGIVANRTADAIVLKDAKGNLNSIPIADIDVELEGKSLMPKGLVNFMTHAEFLDLVAFLSQLGKPGGDFSIRETQRMQRYRLLTDVPTSLIENVPTLSNYEDLVLQSENWEPAYARVNGELPLPELTARTGQNVLYLRGDVDCSSPGKVDLELDSLAGVTVWLDDHEFSSESALTANLTKGIHAIVLRVDTTQRDSDSITLTVKRTPDSKAEFVVVDGQ